MGSRPRIAIVGPGRLGSALAQELRRAGYRISEIISRDSSASCRKARMLAKKINAVAASTKPRLDAEVVWICVPDREIENVARQLAPLANWKNKIAFHSSGALASDELRVLRRRGAAVASVHPLMTFVHASIPSLKGVPLALEGDVKAVRVARRIARDLGAETFSISKNKKSAYHAWGGFASPLLIALLVTGEKVAQAAGLTSADARRKMLPILRQSLANYAKLGPAGAFSGPIVRGDASVVMKHLKELGRIAGAREVYLALARASLRYLPSDGKKQLRKLLKSWT